MAIQNRADPFVRLLRAFQRIMRPGNKGGDGPRLRGVVAAYVRAANALDLEGMLETFADDALVNDQLRSYCGKPAIGEWAMRDIIAVRTRMQVVGVVERYGNTLVTAHVEGDFDSRGLPEPLVLLFHFTLHRDRIVQLIVLPGQP